MGWEDDGGDLFREEVVRGSLLSKARRSRFVSER